MEEQFAHLAVEDEVDVTTVTAKEDKEKTHAGALSVSSSQAPSSKTPRLAVEDKVDVSAKTTAVTTKEDKEKASTSVLPVPPSQTSSSETSGANETAKEVPSESQNAAVGKQPGDFPPPTEEGKL